MNKTKYVAGFLFDKEGENVALIEKLRPDWQKFKLNGIGGHIDRKTENCQCHTFACDDQNFDPCTCRWETPEEAMYREFIEETGLEINDWHEYTVLSGPHFEVYFFQAYSDELYSIDSKTDEQVRVYEVAHVLNPSIACPLIPNLRWLIPMALNTIYEPGVHYKIEEKFYV